MDLHLEISVKWCFHGTIPNTGSISPSAKMAEILSVETISAPSWCNFKGSDFQSLVILHLPGAKFPCALHQPYKTHTTPSCSRGFSLRILSRQGKLL